MRNKLTDELAVCGMNAVLAVGEHQPQTINRLFLREEHLKTFSSLCKQLAERKRPYKICEDEELERICKSVHHQGVVAMIEEPIIEPLSIEDLDLWASEGKTGIVLHSVGNDHNLGAIARAAAFFDAHFIVLNEKDTALNRPQPSAQPFGQYGEADVLREPPISELRLTTSAYRIAEGAIEHLTIRKVTNTAAFLKDAAKQLLVIGTDTRARMRIGDMGSIVKRSPANTQTGAPSQSGRQGIALVLGNEETGLPQNVKDKCSYLLRIPGTGNLDSLNVSQAAALFLYAIFEA